MNARGLLSAAVNAGTQPQFGCEGPDWADYRFCNTEAFSINVGDILSSFGLRAGRVGVTQVARVHIRGPMKAQAVVDDLIPFARTSYPEIYSGVSWDGSSLVVDRVPSPGLPLDRALQERYPTEDIRFEDAPRSESELKKLVRRLEGDRSYWSMRGVDFAYYGHDVVAGVVRVGIIQPAQSADQAFRERYGDAVIIAGEQERLRFPPPYPPKMHD